MSGFTEDKNMPFKSRLDGWENNLQEQTRERCKEVIKLWDSVYGMNNSSIAERMDKIENDLKEFWVCQIEDAEERQRSLMNSIAHIGKEALALEKALGLPPSLHNIESSLPLVQLEEQLWMILGNYQKLRAERVEEYIAIQKKEVELCEVVGEQPQCRSFSGSTGAAPSDNIEVPTPADMELCAERIRQLELIKDQLEYDFETYKAKLRFLLNECEVTPFSKVERFVSSTDEEIDFPATKDNLDLLKSATVEYDNQKQLREQEANELRHEVCKLARKMMLNEEEIAAFIDNHLGFAKSTVAQLKDKLTALKEERKTKLKELILNHRSLLDELWTRCCYSDDQRAEFRPYQVEYYSEEVLDFHELEVERLQIYYNEHERIFRLAEKHNQLWERLLHLEEQAMQSDRLFNNRGGRLLQEEKERKRIQKQLPEVKAKLISLLVEYREKTGQDFQYFGMPLQTSLDKLEEDRENQKENQRLLRKAANSENIMLESRLGSRPAASNKRKLMTPQKPTSASKVMKMTTLSAASSTASVASSKSGRGQKVQRTPEPRRRAHSPQGRAGYATLRTPSVKTPAASTPENGAH